MNGRVGIGCYIERSDIHEELLQQRISDSIYSRDASIKTALQIAKDYV